MHSQHLACGNLLNNASDENSSVPSAAKSCCSRPAVTLPWGHGVCRAVKHHFPFKSHGTSLMLDCVGSLSMPWLFKWLMALNRIELALLWSLSTRCSGSVEIMAKELKYVLKFPLFVFVIVYKPSWLIHSAFPTLIWSRMMSHSAVKWSVEEPERSSVTQTHWFY